MADIDNSEDLISVSDITDRVDELRSDLNVAEIAEAQEAIDALDPSDSTSDAYRAAYAQKEALLVVQDEDEVAELKLLEDLLSDMKGYGGDHQWEGDWYPGTLIRRSHFVTYAQELAEDIGAINKDAGWPNGCIDWDKAARELEIDYSEVDYDGVEYLYR